MNCLALNQLRQFRLLGKMVLRLKRGGFTPSTTGGLISALRPKKVGDTEIQHFQLDAMVTEGNSGAPAYKK